MTDNPDFTLMLEILKNLQAGQGRIEGRLDDLISRVGSVETKLAHSGVDIANLHGRLDHIEQRLGRIERRLELVEA